MEAAKGLPLWLPRDHVGVLIFVRHIRFWCHEIITKWFEVRTYVSGEKKGQKYIHIDADSRSLLFVLLDVYASFNAFGMVYNPTNECEAKIGAHLINGGMDLFRVTTFNNYSVSLQVGDHPQVIYVSADGKYVGSAKVFRARQWSHIRKLVRCRYGLEQADIPAYKEAITNNLRFITNRYLSRRKLRLLMVFKFIWATYLLKMDDSIGICLCWWRMLCFPCCMDYLSLITRFSVLSNLITAISQDIWCVTNGWAFWNR